MTFKAVPSYGAKGGGGGGPAPPPPPPPPPPPVSQAILTFDTHCLIFFECSVVSWHDSQHINSSIQRQKRALYLLTSSKTRSRSDLVGVVNELWAWRFLALFARVSCVCPPARKMLCTALTLYINAAPAALRLIQMQRAGYVLWRATCTVLYVINRSVWSRSANKWGGHGHPNLSASYATELFSGYCEVMANKLYSNVSECTESVTHE